MPARFLAAGDTAITIELGNTAELSLSLRCFDLQSRIADLKPPGLVEVVPTIRSVTVHYDPCITSAAALKDQLSPLVDGIAEESAPNNSRSPRRWLIPACYEPEHGIDMEEIGWATELHPAEVAQMHAARIYRVLMVGFLPGQPYLGELPPVLRLPRRSTPRVSVASGSIGIATTLSVIYPQASPGGWHIVARTPVPLFDASRPEPSLLSAGDVVRFKPITSKEFGTLEARIGAGEFALQQLEAAA